MMIPRPKARITPQDYLAGERLSEFRHEFFHGRIFAMTGAMTGASRRHNRIAVNLARILSTQLAERPCGVYVSDMRVKIAAIGKYTYPDVVVACEEERFEDDEEDTLLNPILIIEILSDSTESYDRGDKFFHYRSMDSFMEYVLISQKEYRVEKFTRQANGSWLRARFQDIHEEIPLRSVSCSLTLREVYERVAIFHPSPPPKTESGDKS